MQSEDGAWGQLGANRGAVVPAGMLPKTPKCAFPCLWPEVSTSPGASFVSYAATRACEHYVTAAHVTSVRRVCRVHLRKKSQCCFHKTSFPVDNPMLEICCTLLHTDGRLLVAQPCCIRWALFAYMRPRNMPNAPPSLGTPPRTPSWGAAAFGIPSAGPPVYACRGALCCTCANSVALVKAGFGQHRDGQSAFGRSGGVTPRKIHL